MMDKDHEIKMTHYRDQCEAGCVEWLEKNGEEGKVSALCLAAVQLAVLTNTKELSDEEVNMLIIYQFAMHGIAKAWEALQERNQQ